MEKKKRPLSQSFSLSNLQRIVRGDPVGKPVAVKSPTARVKSSASASAGANSTATASTSTTNSTATTSTTSTNSTAKMPLENITNRPDKREKKKPDTKRFSLFKPLDESDSERDDSTIDTSPFTNNDHDNASLSLLAISLEPEPETKKRTSNLSNILEFVHQINFDQTAPLPRVEDEICRFEEFNKGESYGVKLVRGVLMMDFFEDDVLGLDDVEEAFSERY